MLDAISEFAFTSGSPPIGWWSGIVESFSDDMFYSQEYFAAWQAPPIGRAPKRIAANVFVWLDERRESHAIGAEKRLIANAQQQTEILQPYKRCRRSRRRAREAPLECVRDARCRILSERNALTRIHPSCRVPSRAITIHRSPILSYRRIRPPGWSDSP